ncbi:MAG: YegS/Rv2252/BmrU family lipid kinase [Emergencia sp.]
MDKVRKVILFYNPNSGNGMFKNNLDHIIGRYQDAGYLVVPIRAAHGHTIFDYLAELDKETYREEYRQIIAAGGDGTINVCVNAMIRHDIDLPLAIMPAGTANDFAYYFNIPNDIDQMLEIAMGDNYTYADVGRVNDRYFINVAAIGQVVGVSQKTDPTLKNTIGVLAYYLKGLSEIPGMKPVKVTLTTPEKIYREKMYFMVVMNGKSAGGFKKISPDSEINDGLLDVLLFRNMSLLEMPGVFMKILQGNHPSSKKVLHFQTSSLKIETTETLPTDIDGEHGERFPMEFSVLHNRLRIHTLEDNMGEE